ncbi:MAG: phosphotransferase [Caldilineaceae bacterium]|nr:phosphotransferase [Caldilineaceae bacterium]
MADAVVETVDGVTVTDLTPLVRKALPDKTAVITDWTHHPLDGGFSGSAVHRFSGTAATATGDKPWSLVRKEFRPASNNEQPDDYDYWKREVLLYQSGLLDALPTNLIAPRCFAIEQTSEQQYWLWLEDMGSQGEEHWPIELYGVAARHLGQFNGTYLVGRPLPTQIWLRKPDVRERLAAAEPGIPQLPTLREHPLFAPLLAGDRVARIQQLWEERGRFLGALEQLPQTFCHRDAFQRNLLMRQTAQGAHQTIALDWGSCGLGMVGEELVPLFAATLRFVLADTARLAEMDEAIFCGYMAGLRDVGWQGDERLVRFGFTALAALKAGVADPATKMPNVARRAAALPPGVEPPKLLNPGGYEQAVIVDHYMLDLGDEARRLLAVIG